MPLRSGAGRLWRPVRLCGNRSRCQSHPKLSRGPKKLSCRPRKRRRICLDKRPSFRASAISACRPRSHLPACMTAAQAAPAAGPTCGQVLQALAGAGQHGLQLLRAAGLAVIIAAQLLAAVRASPWRQLDDLRPVHPRTMRMGRLKTAPRACCAPPGGEAAALLRQTGRYGRQGALRARSVGQCLTRVCGRGPACALQPVQGAPRPLPAGSSCIDRAWGGSTRPGLAGSAITGPGQPSVCRPRSHSPRPQRIGDGACWSCCECPAQHLLDPGQAPPIQAALPSAAGASGCCGRIGSSHLAEGPRPRCCSRQRHRPCGRKSVVCEESRSGLLRLGACTTAAAGLPPPQPRCSRAALCRVLAGPSPAQAQLQGVRWPGWGGPQPS